MMTLQEAINFLAAKQNPHGWLIRKSYVNLFDADSVNRSSQCPVSRCSQCPVSRWLKDVTGHTQVVNDGSIAYAYGGDNTRQDRVTFPRNVEDAVMKFDHEYQVEMEKRGHL